MHFYPVGYFFHQKTTEIWVSKSQSTRKEVSDNDQQKEKMGQVPIVADTTQPKREPKSRTMNSTSIKGNTPFYKKHQTKQLLITGITGLCIFLLVCTAQAKLAEQDKFHNGLLKIRYLKDYALSISWLVPLSEIAIALLLIIPKTQRLGLYLFTTMMSIFTIYIASMLLWAEKKPCHCGGAISALTWEQHLLFNLAFILLAIFGIYLHKNNLRKD